MSPAFVSSGQPLPFTRKRNTCLTCSSLHLIRIRGLPLLFCRGRCWRGGSGACMTPSFFAAVAAGGERVACMPPHNEGGARELRVAVANSRIFFFLLSVLFCEPGLGRGRRPTVGQERVGAGCV